MYLGGLAVGSRNVDGPRASVLVRSHLVLHVLTLSQAPVAVTQDAGLQSTAIDQMWVGVAGGGVGV